MASRAIASRGRLALGLLALSVLAMGAPWPGNPLALAQVRSLEYPIKAAYLPKFAPFVEWPNRAFATPDSPVMICVVGADPFGSLLDKAARSQHLADRSVQVRRLASVARDSGCHILYLGRQQPQAAAAALKAVRGLPVLTVTDAAYGGPRGIIHFVVKDGRVRFQIDDQAAADNGLTISSKLMSLALSVRRRA